MAPTNKLDISLLGTFAARRGGSEIRIASRKACAILGYLALIEPHECLREAIVGLLWSESDERKARASLRQVVHELHGTLAALGFSGFVVERSTLRFATASVSSDVEEILQLAKQGRAHPKLFSDQRLVENLLRDFDNVDRAFHDWLVSKRQSLQDQLISDLSAGLRRLPTGADQLELARAILNLDPTHEDAARTAIRVHASTGDIRWSPPHLSKALGHARERI